MNQEEKLGVKALAEGETEVEEKAAEYRIKCKIKKKGRRVNQGSQLKRD